MQTFILLFTNMYSYLRWYRLYYTDTNSGRKIRQKKSDENEVSGNP